MRDKPIIIELVGPSGSGKSTFVDEAVARNRVFDNVETAAWRGLINHPTIKVAGAFLWRLFPISVAYRLRLTKIVNLYRDQVIRQHGGSYDALLIAAQKLINQLNAKAEEKIWLVDKFIGTVVNHALIKQPVNAGRLVLADEFFIQKAVRLSEGESERVRDYLDLIPKPEMMIIFEIDSETSVERIRSRGGSRNIRAHEMSDDELLERIIESIEAARVIVEILEKNGIKKMVAGANTDRRKLLDTLKTYA